MRSVEAATRDDAIAAAREQFGPSARVVGVRRVRSGGVLGFFATERYVAEVAPDLTKPAVPPTARQDDVPADFSSPLASAAPARARTAAPARNGAAAWAAEGSSTEAPARSSTAARSAAPAARAAAPAWSPSPARRPADEERVSEFASLLAAKQNEADSPTYGRAAFPRAAAPRTTTPAYPATPLEDEVAAPVGDRRVIPADVPDAPSPFTAALARMVAGDREVRQAVEEALVRPGATRTGAEPRPVRTELTEESAAPSSPAPQEEEPVGDQVIAPSSSMTSTVEVPTWAAEPEVVAPSVSPREEAIAEVLRDALAQGHSDEALAGILRKVLDGASPQSALAGPVSPTVVLEDNVLQPSVPVVEPVLPGAEGADVVRTETYEYSAPEVETLTPAESPVAEVVLPELPVLEALVPEPAPLLEAPIYEAPAYEAPVFEVPDFEPVFEATPFETHDLPVHEAPLDGATMFEVPVFETRAATPDVRPADPFTPVTPAPAWVLSPATSMWGPPTMSATLWGEPAAPVVPARATYTPIWAEVSAPAPATVEPSLFEERVEVEAPVAEDVVPAVEFTVEAEEDVPAEVTADDAEVVAADAVVEEPAEADSDGVLVEEPAPLLARTASDPAPTMSFDSTSIMPPLSLLPPLPGSRGRGRPPVPPAPSRRSAASTAAPTAAPSAPEAPAEAVPAPVTDDVWATVTRLPVAPQMTGPEMLERLFDALPETPDEVSEDIAPAVTATGAIADRLVELGVPRGLLGASFADEVAERGTYAALTRALA